jgi:hypothetical protein
LQVGQRLIIGHDAIKPCFRGQSNAAQSQSRGQRGLANEKASLLALRLKPLELLDAAVNPPAVEVREDRNSDCH